MSEVLTPGAPEAVGVCPRRLEHVYRMLETGVAEGTMPGAAICVTRRGTIVGHRGFGRCGPEPDAPSVTRDTVFLIASVTKPIVCSTIVMLAERGRLRLDDPVTEFVPEFGQNGKEGVTLRHMLTHTSGLPDMLPDNTELRRQHAPFSRFVERICEIPLLFPPGTAVSYQSMGIAMLAEVAQRLTGTPVRELLRQEFFRPLGMTDSSLGIRDELRPRISGVVLSAEARASDWGWMSDYWQNFGAPWGGMYASVKDLAAMGQMLLNGGEYGGQRLFGRATAAEVIANQTERLPLLSRESRRRDAWGLGWRLHAGADPHHMGDLLSDRAFGHGGATGTVVWFDPELDLGCALFTNQPSPGRGRFLGLVSNAVAATVIDG
jgi:CubicO group peptidase (beta-lactamase class C family)